MRAVLSVTLVAATLTLAACATRPPASDPDAVADFEQTNDPLEPTNRVFYQINDALDRAAMKPIAQGYVAVVPVPVRNGLHNVLANLSSPVQLVNDVAQGKPRRAGDTVSRFLINSTLGAGGLIDVAKGLGIKAHGGGFDVTLALWGVPEGPYLYLPLLGPGSPRSVVGYAGDIAADPFTWVPHGYGLLTLNWARYGLGVVDQRASLLGDLDKVQASALDPYASIRSLYRQNMASRVDEARHADEPAPGGGKAP